MRTEKTQLVIQGLSAASGGVPPAALQVLQQQQVLSGPLDPLVFIVLSLPFAVVCYFLSQWLLCEIVSRSSLLRKYLYADQHVEGVWISVMRQGDEIPKGNGVLYIKQDSAGVRFSGENFDRKGHRRGTFQSTMTKSEWPILYFDSLNTPNGSKESVIGRGKYHFVECAGPPLRMSGSFELLQDGEFLLTVSPISIDAVRVTDRRDLDILRTGSALQRLEIVKSIQSKILLQDSPINNQSENLFGRDSVSDPAPPPPH